MILNNDTAITGGKKNGIRINHLYQITDIVLRL